jgi:hypothetical protein
VAKPITVAGDRYAWTDDYRNLLRITKEEGCMKFIFPIFTGEMPICGKYFHTSDFLTVPRLLPPYDKE